MKTRIALIPAYQPTSALSELAERLSGSGFEVVIVDDGSGREYHACFDMAKPFATVLSYSENLGKGDALKYGLRYLRAFYDADCVIVTLDCDGQHTVEDAVRVADAAAEKPDSLTLGVRRFGKGTPLRSRMGNASACAAYKALSGVWVSDTQTGLRAFGGGLLPLMLSIGGSRYEYEINVLMECARRRIPIGEVPIATIYLNGNKSSHFHTVRDTARVLGNLFKFAGSSLTGFAIDYSLYGLLVSLLPAAGLSAAAAVPLSNVAARVVSASANFAINRRLVFKSDASALRTGAQYFGLAVCILAGNTVLLNWMVNTLGADRYLAKLVTELTFFTISWIAQRFWIFGGADKNEKAENGAAQTARRAPRLASRTEAAAFPAVREG